MRSLILVTASRYLAPLLLAASVWILLRGHNEPGGGFAGGLLASAAFALKVVSNGVAAARRALRVDPHWLLGAGLLTALTSGLPALLAGRPFLTAGWIAVPLPAAGSWDAGTVLWFDAGVYLVVLGAVLLIVFTLAEE
ncbi:MAG: Na+/H+ antiporter subunit B [Bryobacterales bacterium]|nr:Na+/H+ antiporter subunit B [Bryobacteraceae bacterium]MDW8356059.1 Na+/H+ antiporter subunit B [Bryobacterales bacterium]